MTGVLGMAQHRSSAVTALIMIGVHGKIVGTPTAAVGLAIGGRFDQPVAGAVASYALYLTPGDSAVDPKIAFVRTDGAIRTLSYDTANTRFSLGSSAIVGGTLVVQGGIQATTAASGLSIGNAADESIVGIVFNRASTDASMNWIEGATAAEDEIRFNVPITSTAEIRAGGDQGGRGGAVTFTNGSDLTARSTGVGTILFDDVTNRNSAGFVKIYINSTAYYFPVFSAIT